MQVFQAWLFHFTVAVSNNWHFFTLVSLVFYGIFQYMLDYSINYDRKSLTNSMATYAIVAGNTFTIIMLSGFIIVVYSILIKKEIIYGFVVALFLGVLQGLLYLFVNTFRFEARKVFPQHFVLPVIKASILVVILCSWVLFGEFASVTSAKLVSFCLIGLSIYLFKEFETRGNAKVVSKNPPQSKPNGLKIPDNPKMSPGGKYQPKYFKGLMYLILATIASAAIALLAKYAVGPLDVNIYLFMFFSNFFCCGGAFYLIYSEKKTNPPERTYNINQAELQPDMIRVFKRGLLLGALNFISYASLLKALSLGDASVIIPMYSLYILMPVFLTIITQKEKLTEKTTVAVVLSILAIVMLKD